jgi:CRISPR/Cas system type I-B associated protein Csh2 (Cas7 group RAMP superfamily)
MLSPTVNKREIKHCKNVACIIERKTHASPGAELQTAYVKSLLSKELKIDSTEAETLLSQLNKNGFIEYKTNGKSLTYIGIL